MNTYQGIIQSENVYFSGARINDADHTLVKADRNIQRGEELLIDYGSVYCRRWGIIKSQNYLYFRCSHPHLFEEVEFMSNNGLGRYSERNWVANSTRCEEKWQIVSD